MMQEVSADNCKIIIENTDTVKGQEDKILPLIPAYYADKFKRISGENRYQELLAGYLLYRYLGITSDEQLVRNEHGKPDIAPKYKEDITAHFNLAHSGSYVVLAISDNPVGVDIERKDRMNWKVARRILRPDQLAKLESYKDDPERLQYEFTKYWTQYEAIMKLVGTGFAGELDEAAMREYEKHVAFKELDEYVIAIARQIYIHEDAHRHQP
ncbi:4'-phosphopantetheinyl transferase family protein [Agathobacter sp.]